MNRPAFLFAAAALAALPPARSSNRSPTSSSDRERDRQHRRRRSKPATENNIRAAENALDAQTREWENKSIEVNVSVANRTDENR